MFQGSCNPLTSLSMFITFVEPILLYGCEVLVSYRTLNCYVRQISGRNWKTYTSITKISQQYFCKALKWPSFTVMFLAKLLTSKNNSSSVRIFHTMVSKGDAFKISLVQQCKELELFFGTNYLQQCLNSPDNAIHMYERLNLISWKKTGIELFPLP